MRNITAAATGLILDIQRMSTEDGPGLRTTVFLKGCPLQCGWCHNPESISPAVEIEYFSDQCIGCGECIENCDAGALSMGPDGIIRNIEKCTGCLRCSTNCPALATRARGENYSPEALVHELLKDRAYFGNEGGVTISGGEALFQPEFTSELCRLLKAENINTAIDTCGLSPWSAFEAVFPYTDLFLYDIKLLNPAEHKIHTGADNRIILDNLKRLALKLKDANKCSGTDTEKTKLWVRTPIIPGATDTEENISAIAEFITIELQDVVERWELCAFNNLCTAKYTRFGKEWIYENAALETTARMESLKSEAVAAGVSSQIVFATGMTV